MSLRPAWPGPLPAEDVARLASAALLGRPARRYEAKGLGGGRALVAEGVDLGPDVAACCVIGVFDGFHRGHQALVATTIADARARGCLSAVVTFDPDPASVLGHKAISTELLSARDRVRALAAAAPDAILVLDFTEELSATSYRAFFSDVLGDALRPVSLHVGSDFRLGAQGAGDVSALRELGRSCGMDVFGHDLVAEGDAKVSSTRVRNLLHEGRVERAAQLLGRCHFVRGVVTHGRGEGSSLGFPTANVRVRLEACMPAEGVYACLYIEGGRAWPAAVNVGSPPTFADPDPSFLEANLIGFDGDLYGSEATVIFVRWLRASRPFDSTEELERVVLGDIDWVRTNIGVGGAEVSA